MRSILILITLTLLTALARADNATLAVLPYDERPVAENRIVEERLNTLLPTLMREANIDMWLVIAREYNDDPVFLSLVPKPRFTARRTTILMFHDRGGDAGVERLTISRYPLGELYDAAWEGGDLAAQWERLGEIVAERKPARIAINVSDTWPIADGLSHGLHQKLEAALGSEFSGRLVSSEQLVVRWMETRLPSEVQVWQRAVGLARATIAEAFSAAVITPGVTTTEDVAWFIRSRFESQGLAPWFHPDVNVQRPSADQDPDAPFYGEYGVVIQRGDILHTDVGLCYLALCTDTQEMGYVLRLGETEPPAGLQQAMADGNRWQDLLTATFKTGQTGNEILSAAQRAIKRAGLRSSIYTHPLGLVGHGPGPTIGMWDNQGPTPDRGDWPLYPNTGYAIEGNIKVAVPEFDNALVQMKLEQSAFFDGEQVIYLAGRQTAWHIVR
ncbi:MAG: M24 family metallopeptidase [Pseudomonadota bacterium]